jgi:hypothetical protein
MKAIALAAVLFVLGVSASWGGLVGVSRAHAPNGAGHRNAGPTGATGSTGATGPTGPTAAPGPKAPSSHVKTRWRATVARLPANAATGESEDVSINSISCASRGNCTAVGSYNSKAGDEEGLLLTEKAGRWARGVEAVLPADAASDPDVSLWSVDCASRGNCTAVGTYYPTFGPYTESSGGLLLTEKSGHWATGVEAGLPEGDYPGDLIALDSVSCVSAGNCTAGGDDGYGDGAALYTEKAGHWARRPLSFGPALADITSVSCTSDGRCSAVGYTGYVDGGEYGLEVTGLALTKKRGKWSATDLGDFPGPVSCARGGNCGAIDGDVLFSEKAGNWVGGVSAKPPRNALKGQSVDLADISCPSAGDCVAMGDYYTRRHERLALLTEKAGKWHRGIEAPLARAGYPDPLAISCASSGNCTVVGSYANTDPYENPVSGYHGFLLTEIAGRWARAVRSPHFSGAFDSVWSVSCASPGNCGAIGGDWTSDGPVYGVLFDSTTDPCVVPKLIGKTVHAARHSIESHNCFVGTIRHAPSETVRAGHVISQAHQPGRHLAAGTKINLTVSRG